MKDYSIIEGVIRQNTDNQLEQNEKKPCNPFLFAEGEELRKAMMDRIYKGAGYHNEDQEFFKKLIDLMNYINFLEHKLEKIKKEVNNSTQHLL